MTGDAARDGQFDPHASQPDSQTDKQPVTISSTAAHTLASSSAMPPPPSPTQASSMLPPAAKTPHSDQSAKVPATAFSQDPDDEANDEAASNASSTTSDPNERIEDFDWTSLQQRYHDRMRELGGQEQRIFVDFNELCNYFGVWADASRTHEVGRSFKRLKTQIAYVRHEEDQLESKRQHYIKVVQAFQSALQLLNT
ncbi:hypothetical protein EJ03DRAFT_267557 [Teratosphaeria nubilosa]|uniref:Uncharacterized protein n=1 Tax=Teratosphaeria nubilosa TaxID=161662 RepID=A0A6G1LGS4_9PEZI|nr:hypothetical protein EJ03DRAFT_267557 [Teratosphaeria nubilosa]